MDELNILFTCAGRRVALLDAFRKAMAELNVTGQLLGADVTAASAAYHKVDQGILVPPVERDDYIANLLDIVDHQHVGLLVPLTDLDLRPLAKAREQFAQKGCTVMIGPEETIALCQDKARTNTFLSEIGLASIKTFFLDEFRDQPFYPCFIKPLRGSAGIGTAIINNEEHLNAHVVDFGKDMIVQEYIPGQEFTVDVYRTRAGDVRCVVPRQRLSVRSGEVEKGITVRDESIMDAASKLAEHLDGVWGVICCQCRRPDNTDGSEPVFFEINPRFAGGAPLSIAAGANLPLYVLQELLERPISAEIGNFTEHLLMLRFDNAVFTKVDDPTSLPGYDTPMFR